MEYVSKEIGNVTALRNQLRHVFWIGGGSGAGKSTIARRIADQHSLHYFSTDNAMSNHVSRCVIEECPLLSQFMLMDMDERWVNRSPETMLKTFHWFNGEGFNMIIEDLLSLPKETSVIVEGFRLLPSLVKPLVEAENHAVWLLPTPDFRKVVFNARGGTAWNFLAKTSNPNRALRNLLERDRMFTDRLQEETKRLQLRSIKVDASITEAELADQVKAFFNL